MGEVRGGRFNSGEKRADAEQAAHHGLLFSQPVMRREVPQSDFDLKGCRISEDSRSVDP